MWRCWNGCGSERRLLAAQDPQPTLEYVDTFVFEIDADVRRHRKEEARLWVILGDVQSCLTRYRDDVCTYLGKDKRMYSCTDAIEWLSSVSEAIKFSKIAAYLDADFSAIHLNREERIAMRIIDLLTQLNWLLNHADELCKAVNKRARVWAEHVARRNRHLKQQRIHRWSLRAQRLSQALESNRRKALQTHDCLASQLHKADDIVQRMIAALPRSSIKHLISRNTDSIHDSSENEKIRHNANQHASNVDALHPRHRNRIYSLYQDNTKQLL